MSSAPRCLSLDIATTTGWAMVQDHKFIDNGVRSFKLLPGEHRGHQYIMFYNFLRERGRIDHVFYEEIMFSGSYKDENGKIVNTTNDGRETYLGFKAIMNMFCAGYDIIPLPIWPGTLKKQFAGHGRAEKHDMCRAARELGWKGAIGNTAAFHDEADAIGIMAIKYREMFGVTPRF